MHLHRPTSSCGSLKTSIALPMFIKTQSKKKCKAVSECLQSVQENVVVAFEALKRHFLSCWPAGEVTCLAMKELKKHY